MLDPSIITAILDSMPAEWRGTTFDNSNLLGREQFARNLRTVLDRDSPITTQALHDLGNAEDYLRVATNVSTTLEMFLADMLDWVGVDADFSVLIEHVLEETVD